MKRSQKNGGGSIYLPPQPKTQQHIENQGGESVGSTRRQQFELTRRQQIEAYQTLIQEQQKEREEHSLKNARPRGKETKTWKPL